jgi:hypothetical protein
MFWYNADCPISCNIPLSCEGIVTPNYFQTRDPAKRSGKRWSGLKILDMPIEQGYYKGCEVKACIERIKAPYNCLFSTHFSGGSEYLIMTSCQVNETK